MRSHPNGGGWAIGRGRAAWRLIFILLSLSVARHGAQEPTEVEANLLPTEHPEALPEGGDDSWGWSAGGWLSLGGWSSSWRSMVSGTRSVFRWRFGNVPPEDGGNEGGAAAEERGVTTEEPAPAGDGRRCEELTLEMCRGLGYDATSTPNLLNHESQDIARVELMQYSPLVRVNCSGDMAFFLCALHAPRCSEGGRMEGERLLPCRPLCERVRSRCNVVLERFQLEWPSIFECEKYPDPVQAQCTGQ